MTKKYLQIGCLMLGAVAIGFTACQQKNKQTAHKGITAMQDSIAVITFRLENGEGWGYKINRGSHTFINQDIIPVIMGKHYFQSEEDARKVGEFAAEKVRKNQGGFPDLTRQELLDLKIAGVE